MTCSASPLRLQRQQQQQRKTNYAARGSLSASKRCEEFRRETLGESELHETIADELIGCCSELPRYHIAMELVS